MRGTYDTKDSVTDENTESTPTDTNEGDSAEQETSTSGFKFKCGHCSATYDYELLARVHITRSDDELHSTKNGLMPEEIVEVVDDEGNVIEKRSVKPGDIDLEDLTLDHFPAEFSDKQKEILLAAAQEPYIQQYTELHKDVVTTRLEERGYEPFSYETVRKLVKEFFQPQALTEIDPENGEYDSVAQIHTQISSLTPTKQALIISMIAHPEESNTKIADWIGCSKSYPGQVESDNKPVFKFIKEELTLQKNKSLEEVIGEHFPTEDVAELVHSDLLDHVDIDVEKIEQAASGKSITDDDDESEASVDQPVSRRHHVMTASPHETVDPSPTPTNNADDSALDIPTPQAKSPADSEEGAETTGDAPMAQSEQPETTSETAGQFVKGDTPEPSAEGDQLKADVEDLAKKLQFTRSILPEGSEHAELVENIEEELNDILK